MSTPMEILEFDYANPIKCIYHRPIGKKYVVPHWHEAIEVTYVAKGDPGTMFIEDQTYQLEEGDVYVINSRLIHGFDTVITNNQRIVTLLINYDWLRHCLPKTVRKKSFSLIKRPKKDSQMAAFSELVGLINNLKDYVCLDTDEDSHLHQLSLSVELISILVKNFTVDQELQPQIPQIISQVIEDFQQQYQSEIQLSQMAQKYNYSYAYFSKLFKRYLGISPKKYLTSLRVQKAAEMIETSDDKLSQVALKTGFPDEKSFYAAFKAKYHQTPLEYRKKLQMIVRLNHHEHL
ncbi:AraC family transcriptional regulator [Companilactobacillus farciminis]|nr:AraC family transcriptional regulator [Companilactobacillus farciminis]